MSSLLPEQDILLAREGSGGSQGDLLADLVMCSVFPSQQQTLCFAPPPATTVRTVSALTRASFAMGKITVKTTATRKAVKVLKVGNTQALKNNCNITPHTVTLKRSYPQPNTTAVFIFALCSPCTHDFNYITHLPFCFSHY